MSTAALRQQLQELQEQQKQRYRSRKSTKLLQTLNDQTNDENPINAHQDEDSLDLQTASTELYGSNLHKQISPDEVRINEAQVKHLQHQLEEIQLENAKFRAIISEKDEHLRKVEDKLKNERVAMGGGSSSATQRVVEFSKRNRELGAEVAVEKNKVRLLQKKLKELSAQQVLSDSQATLPTHTVKEPPTRDSVDKTITSLQEELSQCKQKMVDYRNQCQVYKQELKVVHKVVAKEVGEGVSVSALLSGVSGWRGRAQHIIALQNKVADLKQKLESSGTASTGASLSHSTDIRQKTTLQRIEKERQKSLEETRIELEMVKADFSRVQQQCSALKARNKTLAADLKSLKAKLADVTGKRDSQEHEEVYRMLMRRGSGTSANTSTMSNEESHQNWELEKEQLHKINRELRNKLEHSMAELQHLRETRCIDQPPLASSKDVQRKLSNSGAKNTTLPPIKPPFQPDIGRNGKRPPSRTILARKAASAGQSSLRQGDCASNEMQTLAAVSQVERDRLVELTSVLQERLDSATDRVVSLECNLQTLRNHKTEKTSGRIRHTSTGYQKASDEMHDKKQCVSDLETRLAIQLDENAVLKETLEETRRQKMEDMKQLHAMLNEAKQLFVQTLKTNY